MTPGSVSLLLGVAVVAVAIVALHVRVGRVWRARAEAQERADRLAERIGLLGPMLDDAPIGFALIDRDTRFRYANRHYASFTGIPAADHVGRTATELFGEVVGRHAAAATNRIFETGETQEALTVAVPWRTGTRYYLSSRYPVRDGSGDVVGVGFGAIDVTEQRALVERHRRALAELTATVASSPTAIALLGTDLRFRHVNRAFRDLTGDSDRPLVGTSIAAVDGLPPQLATVAARVGRTGVSAGVADVPIRGDGVSVATVSCFPARTDDGEVVAIGLIVMDVSEQHRLARLESEAATLRATAEIAFKLEQAQRLARLGSWEIDLGTGEITWSVQMGAIVGDPGAFLSGGGDTLVHPDDAERLALARLRLLDGSEPFAGEFRLVRPDGSVVDVYGTGEVIRDETGAPVRVWGTLQDVTEQRTTEREAAQARAQLEAEHQALQMFVRAMLPSNLPRVPGSELVAAYLPVVERVDIGGDWFDSFTLPDGRLALAVGDVTGHDLRAATIMGQVRNAVRAYAFEDPSPGEVLRRSNVLLTRVAELDLVTMVFAVYDPGTHELTWANAGHPAPLLRHGDTVTALAEPVGLILGVVAEDVRYAEGVVRLAPGDTVLWYTDGLVDHRGADPEESMRTLVTLLAGADRAPERLLADVTDRLLAGDVQEDDVCLLALHRAPTSEPVPAQPAATHDRVAARGIAA